MKVLPADATDTQILDACREWIELVAVGDLSTAIEMLHVPERYDASQRWSEGSLETYLRNYGSWDGKSDGTAWRVTSAATARLPADRPAFRPTAEVSRHDADPRSGSVELDLPLNGEWSDMTALFEFEPVADGTAISLYDLHVL